MEKLRQSRRNWPEVRGLAGASALFLTALPLFCFFCVENVLNSDPKAEVLWDNHPLKYNPLYDWTPRQRRSNNSTSSDSDQKNDKQITFSRILKTKGTVTSSPCREQLVQRLYCKSEETKCKVGKRNNQVKLQFPWKSTSGPSAVSVRQYRYCSLFCSVLVRLPPEPSW